MKLTTQNKSQLKSVTQLGFTIGILELTTEILVVIYIVTSIMTICNSLGELMRAHEMSCHVTLSCHVISCHFGPTTLYGCTLLLGLQSFVVHLYILGIIAHLLPSVFCTRLLITFIRYYISCAYQLGIGLIFPETGFALNALVWIFSCVLLLLMLIRRSRERAAAAAAAVARVCGKSLA